MTHGQKTSEAIVIACFKLFVVVVIAVSLYIVVRNLTELIP